MKLAVPLVHLNGTPKQRLLDPLLKAYEETEILYRELAQTAPNARDYYVQDNDVWPQAVEQHSARLGLVRKLREELERLINAIIAQKG